MLVYILGLEKTVLKALAEIKSDVKDLAKSARNKNDTVGDQILSNIPSEFPLKTVDELDSFEAWLADETNHRQVVRKIHFQKISLNTIRLRVK